MKFPAMKKIDFNAIASDFRNLDPKDVGRWPLAPRVAVLVGVFFFVVGLAWWLFLGGQLNQLETRQQEELTLKEDFLAKKRLAVNLDHYTEQLAQIDRSFGVLLKQLPNKSEVESLLVEISQSGLGRGLQFELFKPGQEVHKEFYAELPISIRLAGEYVEFGAFASDVAALSRIVTLTDISIAPPPATKAAPAKTGVTSVKEGSLRMDVTAKTFRYLDEEEIAQQKKAAQAAAAKKGAKK